MLQIKAHKYYKKPDGYRVFIGWETKGNPIFSRERDAKAFCVRISARLTDHWDQLSDIYKSITMVAPGAHRGLAPRYEGSVRYHAYHKDYWECNERLCFTCAMGNDPWDYTRQLYSILEVLEKLCLLCVKQMEEHIKYSGAMATLHAQMQRLGWIRTELYMLSGSTAVDFVNAANDEKKKLRKHVTEHERPAT
jgi:hypothetical protein